MNNFLRFKLIYLKTHNIMTRLLYLLFFTFISLHPTNQIKQAIINYDSAQLQKLLQNNSLTKKENEEYLQLINLIIKDQSKPNAKRVYNPPISTMESGLALGSLGITVSSIIGIIYYGLIKQDSLKTSYAIGIYSANLIFVALISLIYDSKYKDTLIKMQEILLNS